MTPLHEDEIPIDEQVVQRLLEGQHPEWSPLAIQRLSTSGSSNVLFRLGDDLLVRLPRQPNGGTASLGGRAPSRGSKATRRHTPRRPTSRRHTSRRHTSRRKTKAVGGPRGLPTIFSQTNLLAGDAGDAGDKARRGSVASLASVDARRLVGIKLQGKHASQNGAPYT